MLSRGIRVKFLLITFLATLTAGATVSLTSPNSVAVSKTLISTPAVSQGRAFVLTTLFLLLPLVLPILLLLAVLVAPVPIVSIPGKRSILETTTEDILYNSEACVERLTCELAKGSPGIDFERGWMHRFLDQMSSRSLMDRIMKASKSKHCVTYTCTTYSSLQKALQKQRP